MNITVFALILSVIAVNPDNGNVQFEVESFQEMPAEECIKQADLINNNPDVPFTMVCSPKINKTGTQS